MPIPTDDFCNECGNQIEVEVNEMGDFFSDGFDCTGGDHSYCSDKCYEKSRCAEVDGVFDEYFEICSSCKGEFEFLELECNEHGKTCSEKCAKGLGCGTYCEYSIKDYYKFRKSE